ncbi:MAG: N-acetyltransferase family protein [Jatrophihabitans sp.]|uniref:GNAT family N-acetyltransferase n=1 Tax=Jatrophihabitans sp. TaxID=1932789 RepID=UPI00391119FC
MTTVIDAAAASVAPETAWGLDRSRADDGPALDRLFDSCSAETVYRRFFGHPPSLPRSYREAVLAEQPAQHDAVVVRYGDGLHVAGLASLAADLETDGDAELGVLVADGWQRRDLGAAMVEVLIARARERGVQRFTAEVLASRSALLRALARRVELHRLTRSADTVAGLFNLAAVDGRPPHAAHLRR